MSRHIPEQISRRSWRAAIVSLLIAVSATLSAALLITAHGRAIDGALVFDQLDSGWTIQAGSAEADRIVLRPTAGSIALALHPIVSTTFTLQARVVLAPVKSAAGLIVQAADPDHFSAFLISNDGYFRVSDYRNGVWIDRAVWRAWPYIHRDGTANMLRAECQADTCTFFVNAEWTWQERGLSAARAVGVVADAQTMSEPFDARFDQIGWRP